VRGERTTLEAVRVENDFPKYDTKARENPAEIRQRRSFCRGKIFRPIARRTERASARMPVHPLSLAII